MYLACEIRRSQRSGDLRALRHLSGASEVLVHRLGGLGFLENTRGRGGELKLARPCSEIRLDEIVRATEPGFDLVECYRGDSNQCLITTPCRFESFDEAMEAWLGVLNKYSLADLVERNPALVRILRDPRPAESGKA